MAVEGISVRGGRRGVRGAVGSAAGLWHGVASTPVVRTVARRLVLSIPLLVVVSGSVFLLMQLLPGNITWTILGNPHFTHLPAERYRILADQLGLNHPLPIQYWNWAVAAVHGNLGVSLSTGQPVATEIGQRYLVTVQLTIGALLVSSVLGVGLGVISAVRGGLLGRALDVFSMAGWALPVYWLAAELVVLFAVDNHWLPATGFVPISESVSGWAQSMVLPIVALSLGPIGGFAKMTRQAMLDAMSSEFVRMARANGISQFRIVMVYAFKSASLQVVTLAGLFTVGLLTGTVFAEQVFALPGLGSLMVTATQSRDVPVVLGVATFFTLIVVVVNLAVDLVYSVLSPKVRVR